MATSPVRPGRRRRHGARLEPTLLVTPGLVYLTVFVVVPVLLVGAYMFATRGRFSGVEWSFTLENFSRALEPIYLKVLADSLLVAGLATALAFLIGYPTAYAITKLPPRWRTVALVLVVVPFWTNFLIRTYAWIVLLNSQGLVNRALVALGLVDAPIELLYTTGAVVVGMVYAYLPLMILPLYAAIQKVDPELLEASANLGATRARTFWSVTFPLTLPAALTGAILVLVPTMGNFVIPELLGGGKVSMVGTLVRDQFLRARDWPFGAVLAMVLIVLLVVLFLVQSDIARHIEGGGRRA